MVQRRITQATNVTAARAAAAGLDDVEVVEADAGTTDAYAGAVPADLVLLCGIFGNVSDADIEATVWAAPSLCADRATVIWTRHRRPPDLTPTIRRWFVEAGFEDLGFDGESFGVGAARLTRPPDPFEPGRRLFTFATGS